MMNIIPNGWQQSQLDALNNLVAMHDAYNLAVQIKNLLNDTSPQAAQVVSDLATLAEAQWAIVKSYS